VLRFGLNGPHELADRPTHTSSLVVICAQGYEGGLMVLSEGGSLTRFTTFIATVPIQFFFTCIKI